MRIPFLQSEKFQRIKILFRRYERHISSASLAFGFIIDNLTLQRIDLLFENLLLLSYITIAGVSIIVYNLHKAGKLRGKIIDHVGLFIPVIIQFAFGGLFSGFIVFYSRSASLLTSWPFLFVLVGILVTGELVRGFYKKLSYQSIVFFLAIFSFAIFYLPIMISAINEWVFLLSGVITLILFYGFFRLLHWLVPALLLQNRKVMIVGVAAAFVIINLFYFANILPPIPLSLKDGDVYYSVSRSAGGYLLTDERRNLFDKLRIHKVMHLQSGEEVYAFSSVFAPTDLNTEIVHEWQYFDGKQNRWVTSSTVSFAIVGGSDGGYRGYSVKRNVFPGKWRVNVTNSRGQVIGRIKFAVLDTPREEELVQIESVL